MIATSLLAVALVSLVQLALVAWKSDQSAAFLTTASVLAQDKMEQLRGAEWPEASSVDCCEYFDAHGRPLGTGSAPPVGTQYVRRWSIDPVAAVPQSARVLQVSVEPRGAAAVRLVSVRSRRTG
jgi:Tfp pilus assembly protein PilV